MASVRNIQLTEILQTIDNSEYILGVFLDLAKAFDTVNHDVLLIKLKHYGLKLGELPGLI